MKTSILIREDKVQIVLSPQNEFEKDLIRNVELNRKETTFHRSAFLDTQGGFIRQSANDDDLLIGITFK